jgi:hypothetical protein
MIPKLKDLKGPNYEPPEDIQIIVAVVYRDF